MWMNCFNPKNKFLNVPKAVKCLNHLLDKSKINAQSEVLINLKLT